MDSSSADPLQPISQAPTDRPFVIAQLGQSLDGRIATVTGESRYINGAAALDHLHRLRAAVDAVVVGAGTIVADDPQLTVRRVAGRSPARVVIDPTGRLDAHGKWLTRDGTPLLLVSAGAACPEGVELVRLPLHEGLVRPAEIVAALFARGYRKLLIEGGARTISSVIDAGCVNRLHLLMAPVIIGSGKTGLELEPQGDLSRALRPPTSVHLLEGGEALFDCALM
jgi:riboflavin-specific deaminase-like protein